MQNYCLQCATENKFNAVKCIKCGTLFGSFTEIKKVNENTKPIPNKVTKSKYNDKFDDLSGVDIDIDFDFSSLAAELEEQLSLKENKPVPSHKKIVWEDLFSKND